MATKHIGLTGRHKQPVRGGYGRPGPLGRSVPARYPMAMSTEITEQQVRHVAQLSRLKLDDQQIGYFTRQLGDVLSYVQKLNELDTDQVEPMAHPTQMTNKLRADEPADPLPIDQVLANARQSDPPFFRVPKVLGEGPGA